MVWSSRVVVDVPAVPVQHLGCSQFDTRVGDLKVPVSINVRPNRGRSACSSPSRERDRVRSARHRRRDSIAVMAFISIAGLLSFTNPAAAATFSVQPSLEQLYVTHATPGATANLLDSGGTTVESITLDGFGSAVFREVTPGAGYRVVIGAESAGPFVIGDLDAPPPAASFYEGQTLNDGYGYITTRDGTKLAARVFLPGPPEDGPYPTVIEYSGYDPAAPETPIGDTMGLSQAQKDSLCPEVPILCKTPRQPGSKLAFAFDFAVVSVNVRGTGCSGGAFDYFERLQRLDGYDVIETVAAQPWVKGHRVGMVGLSYPGISQLFVAPEQPPSLAAIAPMSVYDDTARGILAPGGMYNEGFAFEWVTQVLNGASPYGQGWEQGLVDAGDTQCAENQLLRGFNVNAVEKARQYTFYEPEIGDTYNLSLLAPRIQVPIFTTGQWQDEQTGGRFALLWSKFTNAPVKRFIGMNGVHADAYTPQILMEWKAFLDMYVADDMRPISGYITGFGASIFEGTFGMPLNFPLSRWTSFTSAADARAVFETEANHWIILDRGRGPTPGAPEGGLVLRFTSWPPANMTPQRLYFQPDGSLLPTIPANDGGASRFTQNPAFTATRTFNGGTNDIFWALPSWDWAPPDASSTVTYETPPLAQDATYIGSGSVDMVVRSSMADAEFEVTVTEVRPDGSEMFVQNGWVRASQRALLPESTATMPLLSNFENDNTSLTPGSWTSIRALIFPFGHIFRAGSQVRLYIHSPGGNMARWSLETNPDLAGSTVDIAHNSIRPSSVVLPLVGIPKWYEPALAPCPSLRGQPCRPVPVMVNAVGEAVTYPVPTTTTTTTTTAPTTTAAPTTVAPTTTPTTTAPTSTTSPATTTTAAPTATTAKVLAVARPATAAVAKPNYAG